MNRHIALIALAACLVPWPGFGGDFISPGAREQMRRNGFTDAFIVKAGQRIDPQTYSRDAPGVYGQQDSLPPIQAAETPPAGTGGTGGTDQTLPPITTPEGGETGTLPPIAPADTGTPAATPAPAADAPAPPPAVNAEPAKAPAKKSNGSSGKKSSGKKKRRSAPVVSSVETPAPMTSMPVPAPYLNTPMGYPPAEGEIYSQEPLRLPPVSSLPEPSRTTLPPITRDSAMLVPLGEAVTRVLACNLMGLTGLLHTTSADVSKEGSFKMGFHSSWFTLDRVYDRVLATGESGDILEMPLFFNYAVTNDLEFAFMLPIMNYTVKSRILWSKDFRESGVGDSQLSFKYRIFDNPQYQMRGAFGLGFKFPTGSDQKGLGTGKTDFEVYTAFSKNFERVIAHLNLGYIMTGDPNTQFYPDGLADVFYYNIGLEYPHNHNVTVMSEINGRDQGAEGMAIDVTPGLRYTPTENFAFEVGVPIAVTNDQRYGYNYRIIFGLTAFFK